MFNFLRRALSTKVSKAGPAIAFSEAGQPRWTERNFESFSKEGFAKNVILNRCIVAAARSMAHIPWCLKRGKKEIEDKQHPLLKLLAKPNPLKRGGAAFFEGHFSFYLLHGNSYLEGIGPDGAPPTELWTHRPDRMQIIPSNLGTIEAFEFSKGSQKVRWQCDPITCASPIMHWSTFSPLSDWYGQSPLEAAAYSIDQHNEASAWNQALLQNSGRPSGALVYAPEGLAGGGNFTEQQIASLRQQFEERVQGAKNAGRPIFLDGGMDWKAMGLGPVEMDWLNGKDSSARDVCIALGVPPAFVGVPGTQTFANYEEARLSFYEDTVIPLLQNFTDSLNSWLVPSYSSGAQGSTGALGAAAGAAA